LYLLFVSSTYIIKFSIYFCSRFVISFRTTSCFTDLDYRLIRITSSLIYSGLAWVYCTKVSKNTLPPLLFWRLGKQFLSQSFFVIYLKNYMMSSQNTGILILGAVGCEVSQACTNLHLEYSGVKWEHRLYASITRTPGIKYWNKINKSALFQKQVHFLIKKCLFY
jgi:hypothetical protein